MWINELHYIITNYISIVKQINNSVRQLYGGKPNVSGTKSSILFNIIVASVHLSFGNRGSGNITTCMPASFAPCTPFGESSNTKHLVIKTIISS